MTLYPPDIECGDFVTTWRGTRGVVNGANDRFVNYTADDDPNGWQIPLHRDVRTIIRVERNGRVIWPPEVVQLELF